jgi:hypothetical protein
VSPARQASHDDGRHAITDLLAVYINRQQSGCRQPMPRGVVQRRCFADRRVGLVAEKALPGVSAQHDRTTIR